MPDKKIRLIECPRDALQGWPDWVPTDTKINYLNALLRCGFHTLDAGSFVSPKAIPQMADSHQVLSGLDRSYSATKLLAIVANLRGATEAMQIPGINFLGFPFSVSETFQQRNTNSSILQSLERVKTIRQLCADNQKELVVYLSMGFGNPYHDPFSEELVFDWVRQLTEIGIRIISLADTVGLATPEQVYRMTDYLVKHLPAIEIGVHLHANRERMTEKLDAALEAGCRRIDAALKGIGGCPMANDELVGNLPTEAVINHLERTGYSTGINLTALQHALALANTIFH